MLEGHAFRLICLRLDHDERPTVVLRDDEDSPIDRIIGYRCSRLERYT